MTFFSILLSISLGASVAGEASKREPEEVGPIQKPDSTWVFTHGVTKTRVICAPLRLCDIALQVGEKVITLDAGDSVRWLINAEVVSGTQPNLRQHILVKPSAPHLETTLSVHTTRRTYHIELVSRPEEYMASVEFRYPSYEAQQRRRQLAASEMARKAAREKERKIRKSKTLPQSQWSIEDLSFSYRLRGEAPWKPRRVYSNATKTIIEFPKAISSVEAPTLLLVDRLGLLRKRMRQVNYRVKKNLYIVDAVFSRAVLISGVGRHQRKVVIIKR